jgi:hypothetical protein
MRTKFKAREDRRSWSSEEQKGGQKFFIIQNKEPEFRVSYLSCCRERREPAHNKAHIIRLLEIQTIFLFRGGKFSCFLHRFAFEAAQQFNNDKNLHKKSS